MHTHRKLYHLPVQDLWYCTSKPRALKTPVFAFSIVNWAPPVPLRTVSSIFLRMAYEVECCRVCRMLPIKAKLFRRRRGHAPVPGTLVRGTASVPGYLSTFRCTVAGFHEAQYSRCNNPVLGPPAKNWGATANLRGRTRNLFETADWP